MSSFVKAIDAAYDDFGRLRDVRSMGATDGDRWGGTLFTRNHVRYAYDALDRMTSVTQDIDSDLDASPTGHGARTVGYTYDTAAINAVTEPNKSRLQTVQYPNFALPGDATPPTSTLVYGYDGIARPISIGMDDGGAGAVDIAEYEYIGMGMTARVDFAQINVALDRTVDSQGHRRYGATVSQAEATYPGYDRFGRVKRQAWVPLGYTSTGTPAVPNRRENVNLVYAYDKVGNPISKQQARQGSGYIGRWADRDWEYHYDGLDRLTLARRGVLTVPGLSAGGTFSGDSNSASGYRPQLNTLARGSQKWTLDVLGNWTEFFVDLRTSSSSGSPGEDPNAEFDGDGFDATLERQTRGHNTANELGTITAPSPTVPTGATFVSAPLLMPMTYTHDEAGNRTVADNGLSGGTQLKHQFVYDAWNRLVRIDKWDAAGAGAYKAIAAYQYNGLHWRTRKFAHSTPDATTGKETVFTYNASWQAIVEEIDEDHVTGGESNEVNRVVQQVFGLRGVNDAIYRREDARYFVPTRNILDEEGEIIGSEEEHWVECDGIFDKSFYQLSDAQGSIVSVVSVGAIQVDATHSWSGHQTVDWLEYDPYGRSRRWAKADYNMNGTLDPGDITSLIGGQGAGDKSADADESGTVNVSDIFAHLADWFTGDTTPQDALSHALIDNPYGYCGYYGDRETLGISGTGNGLLYQCRHRVYDPYSGRWLQRDPAGFVDGMNLYQYVRGRSCRMFDPYGKNGFTDWLHNVRGGAVEWYENITGKTAEDDARHQEAIDKGAAKNAKDIKKARDSGAISDQRAAALIQNNADIQANDKLKKVRAIEGVVQAATTVAAASAVVVTTGAVIGTIVNGGTAAAEEAIATTGPSPVESLPDGTFSITEQGWEGYPNDPNIGRPEGPFRLLEGEEYKQASLLKKAANQAMRADNPEGFDGFHIHEIQPVKFGGDPVDPTNKFPLTPEQHSPFTTFWNNLQHWIEQQQRYQGPPTCP